MDRDIRIKKLLYQSIHRGCKETDFIFAKTIPSHIHDFSDEELDWYDGFIKESDWDIYAWITGTSPLPEAHQNRITRMIIEEFKHGLS